MERDLMWLPWTEPGLEHLHLLQEQAIVADGLVLGVQEHKPFRARYEVHCTQHWEVRAVHVSLLNDSLPSLHLYTDGTGHWTTETGENLPSLQGCLDVDISVT